MPSKKKKGEDDLSNLLSNDASTVVSCEEFYKFIKMFGGHFGSLSPIICPATGGGTVQKYTMTAHCLLHLCAFLPHKCVNIA